MKIEQAVMEAVRAHATEGYPNEVCGILAGPDGQGRVTEAHRVRNVNVERARSRYLMDPRDQIRIQRDLDDRGLTLLGYYHSHPDSPARASVTDAGASWAGPGYLIVSCYEGEPREANLFVAEQDGGPMHQEPYTVV
ncbi:MAG: M67 family metallopeptidase [Candidatus Dormibacteraeota bacterium]|nr:M67 family metallopeptidase [Candidatus Dormibacteraeota bacterium]